MQNKGLFRVNGAIISMTTSPGPDAGKKKLKAFFGRRAEE
jgi:hypothetical protein